LCVGNPSPQGGVRQRAGAAPVRLPNLKPSTQTISLRLPLALLERIKVEANKRDMPYQSLINAWLAAAAVRDLRGAVWFLAVEIQSRLRLECHQSRPKVDRPVASEEVIVQVLWDFQSSRELLKNRRPDMGNNGALI
jgi:hypothetical protein